MEAGRPVQEAGRPVREALGHNIGGTPANSVRPVVGRLYASARVVWNGGLDGAQCRARKANEVAFSIALDAARLGWNGP